VLGVVPVAVVVPVEVAVAVVVVVDRVVVDENELVPPVPVPVVATLKFRRLRAIDVLTSVGAGDTATVAE
jgi:hypothetical protein